MKHFYTLTLGALAMILAFAACKKEEAPAGGDEPAMVTASWTASFEDYQSATKAALQDDLSVEWEDSAMDREHGALESCEFVKQIDFQPSAHAFDACFEKK